jgi:hypothetical protein
VRENPKDAKYRSWLWRETWHAGDVLRMMGERDASPTACALQAGAYDGLVRSLAHYCDRDPKLIREAPTMDALWDLLHNGSSWTDQITKETEAAMARQEGERGA